MKKHYIRSLSAATLGMLMFSCGSGGNSGDGELSGRIKIDGSSTVYPITEAVSEEFRKVAPDVRVTVGFSGTGGGFSKFIRGETDINDASREISEGEAKKCEKNGIEYQELSVAYDGLAVVTHPSNDWLDTITVEELKTIWHPDAQDSIKKWSDIRPEWPDKELGLYGPGTASGTFDYFTEAIVGESGKSRGDYTSSEDDNVLVQGVSEDKGALGFFGLAYYEENSKKLKLVAVDNGNGGVTPTRETVSNNTYTPLSRPLYIYVRKKAAKRPEVQKFVEFYLNNARSLAKDVGYIGMKPDEYKRELKKFKDFAGNEKKAEKKENKEQANKES